MFLTRKKRKSALSSLIAGYEWAELHDITDANYDNGNSDSFNEGVREYAEEHQDESEY